MGRPTLPLLLVAALLAGCTANEVPEAVAPSAPDPAPAPRATWPVVCRVLDENHTPLLTATCRHSFGSLHGTSQVGADGSVSWEIPDGALGFVEGTAPGRLTKAVNLSVDGPKRVEMVLEPIEGDLPTNGTVLPPAPPALRTARTWLAPVEVPSSGNEPHLAVDAEGVIYYSPTTSLYRSMDGGATWTDVSPSVLEAPPAFGTDTSLSIAEDGSIWWARTWGYAGGTIGCTSLNKGDSWTCDATAIPGVTDRMWIVGLSATEGYLQTNEGLYHHVWARTTTGSLKYTPHATTDTLLAVRNGNLVHDPATGAVLQIEAIQGRMWMNRVDTATGLVETWPTDVPSSGTLPNLALHDGVLWTVADTPTEGGGRQAVAARSVDGGHSWTLHPIPTSAASVTFTAIAAGPEGRVAVIYYGSDKPGEPAENGGTWSVFVSETDNGRDPNPTWVETRVAAGVHMGNICDGITCGTAEGGENARFSGDLIGIWIDSAGDIHTAYNAVAQERVLNLFLRQKVLTA